jgi:hypothetical protein
MVAVASSFSRHQFLFLYLLVPLTQQGKDGLGYFLVAGNIYPGFPVYVPHHANGVQP